MNAWMHGDPIACNFSPQRLVEYTRCDEQVVSREAKTGHKWVTVHNTYMLNLPSFRMFIHRAGIAPARRAFPLSVLQHAAHKRHQGSGTRASQRKAWVGT
jgi:hypothetical protein